MICTFCDTRIRNFNNEFLELYLVSFLEGTGAADEALCDDVLVLWAPVRELVCEGEDDTIRIVLTVGQREEQRSARANKNAAARSMDETRRISDRLQDSYPFQYRS